VTLPETLTVQAEHSDIARVSDWAIGLAAKYTLPSSTSYALQLCLEEAVSNIVRHGFAEDFAGETTPDRAINVSCSVGSGAVILTIEDGGMAFDPTTIAAPTAPTSLSDAPIGGLGIHLMRQFATALAYERRNGGNRLTLRFEIPTSEA
jgi:anti-sigma regulatory factor (Ser/Thr protein kinase)